MTGKRDEVVIVRVAGVDADLGGVVKHGRAAPNAPDELRRL
jgi:hypothetical protein